MAALPEEFQPLQDNPEYDQNGSADPGSEQKVVQAGSLRRSALRDSSSCDLTCEYKGQSASCRKRISYVAKSTAGLEACAIAHRVVQRQCRLCENCLLADTECLNVDGGESTQEEIETGKRATGLILTDQRDSAPSTSLFRVTALSDNSGCDYVCIYEGKAATCKERVAYAAKEFFLEDEDPCLSALQLVLRQCPSCMRCTLGVSDC